MMQFLRNTLTDPLFYVVTFDMFLFVWFVVSVRDAMLRRRFQETEDDLRSELSESDAALERIYADLDVIEDLLDRGRAAEAREELGRLQQFCAGVDEAGAADERWNERRAA